MVKNRKKKGRAQKEADIKKQDLSRFAGSSDEENDNDSSDDDDHSPIPEIDENNDSQDEDNDDDGEEEVPMKAAASRGKTTDTRQRSKRGKKEESDDDSSSEEEDDEILVDQSADDAMLDPAAKMSNVMSKILGITTVDIPEKEAKIASSSTITDKSVVLGKTVTPLQKAQRQEKEAQKASRAKRQLTRERNLTALHIPLSVATTMSTTNDDGTSIAKELEQERFHRRVATRGVVALFNAISQHQKSSKEEEGTPTSKSGRGSESSTPVTKHSFLDKIKNAAVAKSDKKTASSDATPGGFKQATVNDDEQPLPTKNWDALKDDYMLNPKRNWDEESSDDDEEIVDDEGTKAEPKGGKDKASNQTKKKRRTGSRTRQ